MGKEKEKKNWKIKKTLSQNFFKNKRKVAKYLIIGKNSWYRKPEM